MYKCIGMLFVVTCLVGCNGMSSDKNELTVEMISSFEEGSHEVAVMEVKEINQNLIAVTTNESGFPAISVDTTIQKGDKVRVKAYKLRKLGYGGDVVTYAERAKK